MNFGIKLQYILLRVKKIGLVIGMWKVKHWIKNLVCCVLNLKIKWLAVHYTIKLEWKAKLNDMHTIHDLFDMKRNIGKLLRVMHLWRLTD